MHSFIVWRGCPSALRRHMRGLLVALLRVNQHFSASRPASSRASSTLSMPTSVCGRALSDPSLFHQQCYIGGAWCDADSGKTLDVLDPATSKPVGKCADMGAAETRRAIEAAAAAWPAWRAKTGKERGAVLRRWFELINENAEVHTRPYRVCTCMY